MSQDNEILVRVDGVSKKFCRDLKKSLWYGVKDVASELIPNRASRSKSKNSGTLRSGEFWANKDISFELRRGECLGLVGHNGAGKTTLLKALNGLIKPDEGTIEMRGRVGALIALGAGFNPILTGRENVYVNGSILGLSTAEISAKFDEIVEFAEIAEFIDTPVQSYSSGMQVRLGFAVATALDPDILILDEVLAVGDAKFRSKCYRRIIELRRQAAVIFVSHNMEQVARICDITLMMSRGQAEYLGDVAGGVKAYENANDDGGEVKDSFLSLYPPIIRFEVIGFPAETSFQAPLEFEIEIESLEHLNDFTFHTFFYSMSGTMAAQVVTRGSEFHAKLAQGVSRWIICVDSVLLKNGRYRIGLNLVDEAGDILIWSYKNHEVVVVNGFDGAITDCQLRYRTLESKTVEGNPR